MFSHQCIFQDFDFLGAEGGVNSLEGSTSIR